MVLKIGMHEFKDRDKMEALLRTKMVKEYDFSAAAREKHEEEAVFLEDGRKIKLTREELIEYRRKSLNTPPRQFKPLLEGEKVPNPWK